MNVVSMMDLPPWCPRRGLLLRDSHSRASVCLRRRQWRYKLGKRPMHRKETFSTPVLCFGIIFPKMALHWRGVTPTLSMRR